MPPACVCDGPHPVPSTGRYHGAVKPSSPPGMAELMSLAVQQLAPLPPPAATRRAAYAPNPTPFTHPGSDGGRSPPPRPPVGAARPAGPLAIPPYQANAPVTSPLSTIMPLSQLMKAACQAVPAPPTGGHPFLTKGQLKRIKTKGTKAPAPVVIAPPAGLLTPPSPPPAPKLRTPPHFGPKTTPAPLRVPDYLLQACAPEPSPTSPSESPSSGRDSSEDDSVGEDSESWTGPDNSPLLKGFGSSALSADQLEGHSVFQALAFDLLHFSPSEHLAIPLAVLEELQNAAL
jgi:hypothetical protein